MKTEGSQNNKLDIYERLSQNPAIYIRIEPFFVAGIKKLIITKYGTLKKFNKEVLKINYPNVKHDFRLAKYHSFIRWISIIDSFGINREELYKNTKGFRINGSHGRNIVMIPRILEIDEKFTEGYALYIAEGDTGLSGKKIPRKLRFTNSNLDVIKFFINWLKWYFPKNYFYINIILPESFMQKDIPKNIVRKLGVKTKQIKIKKEYYNKIIKYKICCDSAIIIDLVLSLDRYIKSLCKRNKLFAVGYIKGIMAGEGTVYFNRSRYVRIEMKNEIEIKYVYSLLKILKYKCNLSLRKERLNMWSIFIGAKQLEKFYKEIGFGSQLNRQNILKLAVNKKLRVNQYI